MKKRLLSLCISVMTMISLILVLSITANAAEYDWYNEPAKAGEYTISNAEELEEFANIVNGTAESIAKDNFAGKKVTLANDLTLTEWNVAIGNSIDNAFAGTFDGCNHTITYTITSVFRDDATSVIGNTLFGYVYGTDASNRAGVCNLTVDASIDSNISYAKKDMVAGVIIKTKNALIQNVTTAAKMWEIINNSERVYTGGISVYDMGGSLYKECTNNISVNAANYVLNTGSTFNQYFTFGGIVGRTELGPDTGLYSVFQDCINHGSAVQANPYDIDMTDKEAGYFSQRTIYGGIIGQINYANVSNHILVLGCTSDGTCRGSGNCYWDGSSWQNANTSNQGSRGYFVGERWVAAGSDGYQKYGVDGTSDWAEDFCNTICWGQKYFVESKLIDVDSLTAEGLAEAYPAANATYSQGTGINPQTSKSERCFMYYDGSDKTPVNNNSTQGEQFKTISGLVSLVGTFAGNYDNGAVVIFGKAGKPVAQIDSTKYESLEAAVAAATSGQTIELLSDIELEAPLTVNKNVVIDGKSTYTIKAADTFSGDKVIFADNAEADVTLKDVTVDANEKCRVIRFNAGKLTIDGATVTNGKVSSYAAGIYMTGSSEFLMKSGNVKDNTSGKTDYFGYADDLWIGSQAKGKVTGGTIGNVFVNSNEYATPANGLENAGGTITNVFVEWDGANIATFTFTSGTVTKVVLPTDNADPHVGTETITPTAGTTYSASPVAQNVETGVSYSSLSKAIAAVPTGSSTASTIKLLDDVNLGTSEISVGNRNIILDMNGKTISGTNKYDLFDLSGSTMTLTGNGTFNATGSYIFYNYSTTKLILGNGTFDGGTKAIVNSSGSTIVKNGSYKYDMTKYCLGGYKCVKNAETNMYDVTTVTEEDAVATVHGIYCASVSSAFTIANENDTVTLLKDVTEDVTVPAGVTVTLDLAGHTLTGSLYNYGNTTVTGNGTITKIGHTLYLYGGVLTIENGNITSTGTNSYRYCAYGTGGKLVVTGGTFTSAGSYTINTSCRAVLSGGAYTHDVTAFVAAGYKCVKNNETNMYDVVEATQEDAVATVGGKYCVSVTSAFGSANENDTVILLKDVSENVTVPADVTAKLDLAGYTLTGKITNNGNLTIDTQGKVVCDSGNPIYNKGTISISKGEFKSSTSAALYNYAATANITGGSFESDTSYALYNYGTSATATITDGKFTAPTDVYRYSGTVTISGGWFSHPVNTDYCASDKMPDLTAVEGYYTVKERCTEEDYPAVLTYTDDQEATQTVYYLSVSEAITAANGKNNAVVTVRFDASAGSLSPYGKCKLVVAENATLYCTNITLSSSGVTEPTVVVENNGTIIATSNILGGVGKGSLTNNGVVKCKYFDAQTPGWINNGTITATSDYASTSCSNRIYSTFTNNGTINATVDGAQLDVQGNVSGTSEQTFINPDVYSWDEETSQWISDATVELWREDAKVGGYSTFTSAWSASQSGDTIKLKKDCSMSSKLTIADTKVITVDLNGKILTCNTQYPFKLDGTSSLTVMDSSADKNGKINHPTYYSGYSSMTFSMEGNATLNLKDITIDCKDVCIWAKAYKSPTVTIDNVTINAVNGGAINFNGNSTVTCTINNSTLASPNSMTMYLPGLGTTTINNSTITGSHAIGIKGGTLNITGNSVVHSTSTKHNVPTEPYSSGIITTGDAIYIEDNYGSADSSMHNIAVNISGGTITSDSGYAIAGSNTTEETGKIGAIITINGAAAELMGKEGALGVYTGTTTAFDGTYLVSAGHYSSEPDASYIVPGYAVIDDTAAYKAKGYDYTIGTGVALVTTSDGVRSIYQTLADAFAAANSGDTITMLADVELSQGIDLATDVTLDLNGKAISAVATGWTKNSTGGTDGKCDYIFGIRRGGKLTVNDSSTNKNGAINASINTEEKVGAAIKMTIFGDGATGDAAELIVNGGTVTGYYYAISGNGGRPNTAITINGGTITATAPGDNQGIYNPQDGSVTINGGTITAYSSAVEMRSGEITVTGGTLTATSTEYSCNPNGSGTTTIGAALAIAQHTTQVDIDVEITGGRFTGVKAINESNPQGNVPAPKVTMSVTGGRFKGEITLTDTLECLAGGIYSVQPAATYLVSGKAFKGNIDESTVGDYPYMVDEADKVVISTSSTLQVGEEKKSTTVATITGGGQYKAGTEVTLKATAVDANSIFTFDGWYVKGSKVSDNAEYTFTAEADAEYVANFTTSSTQEITTTVSKTGDEAAVAAGTVTVKAGTEAGSSSTTKQIGTEVELTATAGTNTYFICWENTDGNVVSTSPTFTATPVQTQTISAVFYDEAAARVSFNDDSGALLKAQMYKESEAGEVTDVVAPAKRGQDFKGWSGTDGTVMTDKQVASAIKTAATEAGEEVKAGRKSSALGIVNVQAVYEKATTYKIIIHSIDSEGTTVCRDLEATATYGESHVVTASLTCGNKTLVGFSKTDDVSAIFTNSASFTISPDEDDVTNGKVEYYAIYGDAPASRIAALSLGKFFDGSTNVHMLAATMSWSLPEGATLVEAGFYYSTSGKEDLDGCSKKYTTTLTDTSGSYTVYMNLQGYEEYYMYMRAFVTYTDQDGITTHTVVNGVEGSDKGAEVVAETKPISSFEYVKKCWNDVKPAE